LKTVKGAPRNISTPIIGRIKKGDTSLSLGKDIILATPNVPRWTFGTLAVVTTQDTKKGNSLASVSVTEEDFHSLNEGDVIRINPNGSIEVMWESTSQQNAIFVTDFCNSACIMCPQKTSDKLKSYSELNKRILSLVQNGETVEHIGITGGEPTVCLDSLIEILSTCKSKFPKAAISLLTNGKSLSDFAVARRIVDANPNTTYCVPIYAPTDVDHDAIVGVPGSFQQTITGLYNLARFMRPVEIRIVLIKQNYQRLEALAEFIYRNMPFAIHIAIMGMETSGIAGDNLDSVWVDPKDYQQELQKGVAELHRRNMNVSIYNLPHCLLPKALWKFARSSISGWKKVYLSQCENCCVKEDCGGTFATSVRQSSYITPV